MAMWRAASFYIAFCVAGAVTGFLVRAALDRWVLCDLPCMLADRGVYFTVATPAAPR